MMTWHEWYDLWSGVVMRHAPIGSWLHSVGGLRTLQICWQVACRLKFPHREEGACLLHIKSFRHDHVFFSNTLIDCQNLILTYLLRPQGKISSYNEIHRLKNVNSSSILKQTICWVHTQVEQSLCSMWHCINLCEQSDRRRSQQVDKWHESEAQAWLRAPCEWVMFTHRMTQDGA